MPREAHRARSHARTFANLSGHSNTKKIVFRYCCAVLGGFKFEYAYLYYASRGPRTAEALWRSALSIARVLIVCVFMYIFIYIYVYIFMCIYIFVPREAHALPRHSGGALSSARCVCVCVCVCVCEQRGIMSHIPRMKASCHA